MPSSPSPKGHPLSPLPPSRAPPPRGHDEAQEDDKGGIWSGVDEELEYHPLVAAQQTSLLILNSRTRRTRASSLVLLVLMSSADPLSISSQDLDLDPNVSSSSDTGWGKGAAFQWILCMVDLTSKSTHLSCVGLLVIYPENTKFTRSLDVRVELGQSSLASANFLACMLLGSKKERADIDLLVPWPTRSNLPTFEQVKAQKKRARRAEDYVHYIWKCRDSVAVDDGAERDEFRMTLLQAKVHASLTSDPSMDTSWRFERPECAPTRKPRVARRPGYSAWPLPTSLVSYLETTDYALDRINYEPRPRIQSVKSSNWTITKSRALKRYEELYTPDRVREQQRYCMEDVEEASNATLDAEDVRLSMLLVMYCGKGVESRW
ncbi:hypothetical protein BDQ17DRAFT_1334261 [Cyathus striatus]|nr:hypothetical protein BDQ17DRAFT_1334261 [Cyathus striatus]